jgi:hypothetical protein
MMVTFETLTSRPDGTYLTNQGSRLTSDKKIVQSFLFPPSRTALWKTQESLSERRALFMSFGGRRPLADPDTVANWQSTARTSTLYAVRPLPESRDSIFVLVPSTSKALKVEAMLMRTPVRTVAIASCVFLWCVPRAASQGGQPQSRNPLPPVDTTQSLTQAERALAALLGPRNRALEVRDSTLEARLAGQQSPGDRIGLLEQHVKVLEDRDQTERAYSLGIQKTKYVQGYTLYSDMQTLSGPLRVDANIVSAYNSTFELTDLRKYSGFASSMDRLLQGINQVPERNWLRGLVTNAIVPAVRTIAELTPLRNIAQTAFARLNSVLPIYAKAKFTGQEFVDRFDSMSCALQTVNQLHTDIAGLAEQNLRWKARVDSVVGNYSSLRRDYLRPVVPGNSPVSTSNFVLAVEAKFDSISTGPADRYHQFSDSVSTRVSDMEGAVLTYHRLVSDYLDYWRGFRHVLELRRDTQCLGSNANIKAQFNSAIAATDSVISGVSAAYLFESNEKPEYEYFRRIVHAP